MNMQDYPIEKLITLAPRAAIITGAERGIGRAIALKFAQAGADLFITGLDQESLDQLQLEIETRYQRKVVAKVVNLLNAEGAQALVTQAMNHWPHIDIIVNNAGIFPSLPTLEISDTQWDDLMSINLRSAFIASREFSKRLIAKGCNGTILNMLSISGLTSGGNATHYVASKHALAGVTKSMAVELGPMGIRVIGLAPGLILTPGVDQLIGDSADVAASFNDYAQSLPLGRAGTADEVANVALFAVSELASFVTGTIIPVDGGALAL